MKIKLRNQDQAKIVAELARWSSLPQDKVLEDMLEMAIVVYSCFGLGGTLTKLHEVVSKELDEEPHRRAWMARVATLWKAGAVQ